MTIGTRVVAAEHWLAASQHPSGPAIYHGVGVVIGVNPLLVHWPSGAVGPVQAKDVKVLELIHFRSKT